MGRNTNATRYVPDEERATAERLRREARANAPAAWRKACVAAGRVALGAFPDTATAEVIAASGDPPQVIAVPDAPRDLQIDPAMDGVIVSGAWAFDATPEAGDWLILRASGPSRDHEPAHPILLLLRAEQARADGSDLIVQGALVPAHRWVDASLCPNCESAAADRLGAARFAVVLGVAEAAFDELASGRAGEDLRERRARRAARVEIRAARRRLSKLEAGAAPAAGSSVRLARAIQSYFVEADERPIAVSASLQRRLVDLQRLAP